MLGLLYGMVLKDTNQREYVFENTYVSPTTQKYQKNHTNKNETNTRQTTEPIEYTVYSRPCYVLSSQRMDYLSL